MGTQAQWNNKTVLVCGASAGLGFQLADALAVQGARVLMIGRDAERLNVAKSRIFVQWPHAQLRTLSGDMCDAASTSGVAAQIKNEFAALDLVINAVGQSDRGSLETLSMQRLLELVQVNVGSGLNSIQQFGPLLRPSRGVLVLIGSLSSHFAPRYLGGYSIAKHGLAALAQQARLELAAEGVHVLLASPGPIARADAGQRYSQAPQAAGLPPEALKSGGGAKVKGLDPVKLSQAILQAAAHRQSTLILPRRATAVRKFTA